MSNPFSVSDIASPGTPVRPSQPFVQQEDASTTTSASESEEITIGEYSNVKYSLLEGSQEARHNPKDQLIRSLAQEGYDSSNANTPRLPPAGEGKHDLGNVALEDSTLLNCTDEAISHSKNNHAVPSPNNPPSISRFDRMPPGEFISELYSRSPGPFTRPESLQQALLCCEKDCPALLAGFPSRVIKADFDSYYRVRSTNPTKPLNRPGTMSSSK